MLRVAANFVEELIKMNGSSQSSVKQLSLHGYVISQLQNVIDARMRKQKARWLWNDGAVFVIQGHNTMMPEQMISFLENDKMNGANMLPSHERFKGFTEYIFRVFSPAKLRVFFFCFVSIVHLTFLLIYSVENYWKGKKL